MEIATATASNFAATLWVPGTAVSREDARIASEQAWRVVSIASVGDVIAKGEVIARLDDEALWLMERDNAADRNARVRA